MIFSYGFCLGVYIGWELEGVTARYTRRLERADETARGKTPACG